MVQEWKRSTSRQNWSLESINNAVEAVMNGWLDTVPKSIYAVLSVTDNTGESCRKTEQPY
jgi:hypothetical protein